MERPLITKGRNFTNISFPWNRRSIKVSSEGDFFLERTKRNREIITEKEQLLYRNGCVGIAGLSVGSAILTSLVRTGGPKKLKIADFDTIEPSNLNRMNATAFDISLSKTIVAARNVWEVDPFADIVLYRKGINKVNLEEFLDDLDIFVDETDSLELKIATRHACKKRRIPVIMATDNGDGAIIDIERYDLEPNLKIFGGVLGDIQPLDVQNISKQKWLNYANKIIGKKYLTKRMISSLKKMGKSIEGIPQLATGAGIAGSAVAYITRMILINKPIKSGKYIISPEKIFS